MRRSLLSRRRKQIRLQVVRSSYCDNQFYVQRRAGIAQPLTSGPIQLRAKRTRGLELARSLQRINLGSFNVVHYILFKYVNATLLS